MVKKILAVLFLCLVVTLSACQNDASSTTGTLGSTTSTNTVESTTTTSDSTNPQPVNKFSWVDKSELNGLSTPYTMYTLNDGSYYIVGSRDIKLINPDGTVDFEKTYTDIKVLSISRDTKELIITHYKNDRYYVLKLNPITEIWESGPYSIIHYYEENDVFIVYNSSIDSYQVVKFGNAGNVNILLTITHLYRVIDNQHIIVQEDGENGKKYFVNYNMNGKEQWRIGPFSYGFRDFNCFITSNNEIIYSYQDIFYHFIFKLNSELTEVWASTAFDNGTLIDYRVYNDELYYIIKNVTDYSLIKLNNNNEPVFQKDFGHPISFEKINSSGVSIIKTVEEIKTCNLDECQTTDKHLILYQYDHVGNMNLRFDIQHVADLDYYPINTTSHLVVNNTFNYVDVITILNSDGSLEYSMGPYTQLKIIGHSDEGVILYTYSERVDPQSIYQFVGLVDESGEAIVENILVAIEQINDHEYMIYYLDDSNHVEELKVTL